MAYEDGVRSAQSAGRPNNITLENRKKLSVTGVEDVVRFDENEIALQTANGELVIRGENLRIGRLTDSGEASVTGSIGALYYEERAPRQGLWTRLLR